MYIMCSQVYMEIKTNKIEFQSILHMNQNTGQKVNGSFLYCGVCSHIM